MQNWVIHAGLRRNLNKIKLPKCAYPISPTKQNQIFKPKFKLNLRQQMQLTNRTAIIDNNLPCIFGNWFCALKLIQIEFEGFCPLMSDFLYQSIWILKKSHYLLRDFASFNLLAWINCVTRRLDFLQNMWFLRWLASYCHMPTFKLISGNGFLYRANQSTANTRGICKDQEK